MISKSFKKYIISNWYKTQFNNNTNNDFFIILKYNSEKINLLFKKGIENLYKIWYPDNYLYLNLSLFNSYLEISININYKYIANIYNNENYNFQLNYNNSIENFNSINNDVDKTYSEYLEDVHD